MMDRDLNHVPPGCRVHALPLDHCDFQVAMIIYCQVICTNREIFRGRNHFEQAQVGFEARATGWKLPAIPLSHCTFIEILKVNIKFETKIFPKKKQYIAREQ